MRGSAGAGSRGRRGPSGGTLIMGGLVTFILAYVFWLSRSTVHHTPFPPRDPQFAGAAGPTVVQRPVAVNEQPAKAQPCPWCPPAVGVPVGAVVIAPVHWREATLFAPLFHASADRSAEGKLSGVRENVLTSIADVLGDEKAHLFVDVGVEDGIESLAAALAGHRVVGFSPLRIGARALQMSAAGNDVGERVTAHHNLLGDGAGTAFVQLSGATWAPATQDNGEEVAMVALDDVVSDPIMLLRLNQNGMESDALAGATKLLGAHKIANILTRFSPPRMKGAGNDPASFLRMLHSSGFACRDARTADSKPWTEPEFTSYASSDYEFDLMCAGAGAGGGAEEDWVAKGKPQPPAAATGKPAEGTQKPSPAPVAGGAVAVGGGGGVCPAGDGNLWADRAEQEATIETVLADYLAFHREETARDAPLNEKRYLVVVPRKQMGMGNKMEGVISAFLIAILTRRALVFEEPFIHSTLSTQNNADVNHAIDRFFVPPEGIDWHYSSTVGAARAKGEQADERQYTVIHGGPDTEEAMRTFLCKDIDEVANVPVLKIDANQYFAQLLQHNPHYQKRIIEMFGGDIFGPLARLIMRPTPAIQARVDEFKAKHFARAAGPVFGLQIRADFTDTGWAMDDAAQPLFFKCAEAVRANHFTAAKAMTLFLATDTMALREKGVAWLKEVVPEGVAANVVWYDAPVERDSATGVEGALIDILLLAAADHRITSASSTFGYVAHGLASSPPYVIGFRENCYREISSQPCFHWWNAVWDLHQECFSREKIVPDAINVHSCWQGRYPDVYIKKFHQNDKF